MSDLNFPFEACEPAELPDEDVLPTGGVIILSAIVGGQPALMFRFAKPDGSGFYPPVLLISDREQLEGLPALVQAAADRALEVTA